MDELDTIDQIDAPARRGNQRSRIVVVAAVAALTTGALGFLAGRSAHDPVESVAGAPPAPLQVQEADTVPDESTVVTATATSFVVTVPAPTPTAAPAPPPSAVPAPAAVGFPAADMAEGPYFGDGGPMELVAERVTADGITLRAHRRDFPQEMRPYPEFPDWTPPGWCFPSGELRISAASATAIFVTNGPWFSAARNGLSATPFVGGTVESAPFVGLTIQVADDVSSVRMTLPSGATDEASAANGVVVLAVPTDDPEHAIAPELQLTVARTDGSSTDTTLGEIAGGPDVAGDCQPPPPALPPAGEQPQDPAAAEAAFREAWAGSRGDLGTIDNPERAKYMEDTTGIAEAWEQVANGSLGETAKASTTEIRELVFTSPTEVWFRYDLLTPMSSFFDRYGIAHLGDDGLWKITRATICQDLALVVACDPPVQPVLPPSAANDPRYDPQIMPGYPVGPTTVPLEEG
jgi:hypothetical protein